MAKEKPGVMMYWETFDVLEALLDGQAKTMLRAIRNYSQYGEVPDFGEDTILTTLWMLFQPKLDADNERYEQKRTDSQYANYCRWAREKGETPLPRRKWLEAIRSDATGCDRLQDVPTTASTATPTPNPEANSKAKSNPVYEGRRDCANAHSAPRTNLPSVALTPEQEAENERLRKEAMDKLRGWQG